MLQHRTCTWYRILSYPLSSLPFHHCSNHPISIIMSIPSSLQKLDANTLQRFREIVTIPAKFDSTQEEATCQEVVDSLSPDEVEATANISYAYWALKILGDEDASPEVARQVAMKVIRWHVQHIGGNNNVAKSLKRIHDALQIREEQKIELFRTCFDPDATSEDQVSIRTDVRADLEKQLQVLRGQDKAGRAVVLKLPRMQGGTTEQAYIRQQLYAAERSAAVTEFLSMGEHDTVCAVFNLQNQNSKNTPSLSWQLSTIKLLQAIFPGRMGKVLVLEAPFLIRQIFNAIKPFLSASLKESTFLVAGNAKAALLEETLVDPNILTEEGTLVKPVDLEKYLTEVPFHCPYDYIP